MSTHEPAQDTTREAAHDPGHAAARETVQEATHHASVTRDLGHPAISLEGYAANLLWLEQAERDYAVADHQLLAMGLPQGRILRATIDQHPSKPSIVERVVLWDQHDDRECRPRILVPAALCVLRLLLLPKALIRVDHTDATLHYITVYGDITLLRIIANAQPNEVIEQRKDAQGRVADHYDLSPANLVRRRLIDVRGEGRVVGPTHQGRKDAVQLALKNIEKKAARPPHPITRRFYAALLKRAFALLDKHHRHEIGSV